MLFQYDETYQQKKVVLVLSGILLGREGLDLEFPSSRHLRRKRENDGADHGRQGDRGSHPVRRWRRVRPLLEIRA